MKKIMPWHAGLAALVAIVLALPWAASAAERPAVVKRAIRRADAILKVDAAYPEVSGLRDAALAERINRTFKDSVDAAIREVEDAARADAQGDYGIDEPYTVFSDFKVRRNDGKFLSVCMLVNQYMGGAHGGSYSVCVNARDGEPGAILSLRDLFVPGADDIGTLNGFVEKWLAKDKTMAADNTFGSVREDQWFYLTDKELVLVFGEYEIGPYAFGMPEVRIPLAKLSEMLIPELRK